MVIMINRTIKIEAVAAFIVAFFYILSYAGAYQYESCPNAAQVDNAWWNPGACEGGIYQSGSLYFKWAEAPFDNQTMEITSVSLVVSTKSKGTDMRIYVWNGNSWSSLSGGRIDFMGDYVYDLTSFPGPYMDGSLRIKITNDGFEELKIGSLKLSIEYESRMRTLSVLVRNCESNTRVRDAEVTANGVTVETNSDGIAELSLPKDEVYEIEIGGEDYHETSMRIYLDDDKELEVCTYIREIPEVAVYDLEVEDGVITFYIGNTGNFGDNVKYSVAINGNIITQSYVYIDEDGEERIMGGYDFQPGRHRVRARAELRGYADAESTTYCVTGETENYVCSGKNVVREIIKSGCVSYWDVVEQCEEGCSDGKCVYGNGQAYPSDISCKAEITSLSYADNIVASELVNIDVKVKNTGQGTRKTELKLYIDGIAKDTKSLVIAEGRYDVGHFQFRMSEGSHVLKIEAVSCDRVRDTISEVINVKPRPEIAPSPEEPQVPESPPLSELSDVRIEAIPDEIRAAPGKGSVIKVTVYSSIENEYAIEVTGIGQEYVDYPGSITVWGREHFYVYLTSSPAMEGSSDIRIRVSKGALSAETKVTLHVGSDAAVAGSQDPFTGLVSFSQSDWIALALIVIVMAAVFAVLFRRFVAVEKAEGNDYDFSKLEGYDHNVRKAAVR